MIVYTQRLFAHRLLCRVILEAKEMTDCAELLVSDEAALYGIGPVMVFCLNHVE